MPKTNWEFVDGQNATSEASNPFPRGSGSALSWDLGRRTPKRQLPDTEAATARLLKHGLQGHNAKELAAGPSWRAL